MPRIVIAGTHSGVGKTTITIAVMAALRKAGLQVQPYKVGPDYIDPGYHFIATGQVSRNLDVFFLGEEGIREIFTRSANSADISVIEGVMGLYDGVGSSINGSTAHVARVLGCPVILVIDARSMAHSAAAVVWGYANFPEGVPIAGVIINRAGSRHHFELLKQAIEQKTGVPVLGGILRDEDLTMPGRHLGLVPGVENDQIDGVIKKLAYKITQELPVEKLINIANSASPICRLRKIFDVEPMEPVRLGIVMDEAFNFYYQDGLDLLTEMGAQLVKCSALEDEMLPSGINGLYIGGGFPEVFIERLAENSRFISDLKRRVADENMPIYAECGGLMYLCESITDFSGREHLCAGIIPAKCEMRKKRAALGYVNAKALKDNVLVSNGTMLRGHEFHYSIINRGSLHPAFYLEKPGCNNGHYDGHAQENVLATYLHIHFAGSPTAARGLIQSCARHTRIHGGN